MKIDIYKIYNDDMAYIGSSKNFKDRMRYHKSDCYNENRKSYNLFIYQYIRTHGGWDEFTKEIIHTCEVADDTEQRMVEQEFIKNNECKLNCKKSYQTKEERKEQKKEWNEKNKEKIQKQKKECNEQNKERRNQKTTCECGSIYRKGDKTKHERTNKHKNFIAQNNDISPVLTQSIKK